VSTAANVAPGAVPDVSYDAVVVLPGIMGTVLKDGATGELLWGFSKLALYSRFWLSSAAYERLVPTPDELEGKVGRIVPAGPLKLPAFAPILRGMEGYWGLVDRARSAVVDPAAVLEFGYDWRLSVEHNARCLARAARKHLDEWRTHPIHKGRPTAGARRAHEPRLVIVAHSMGGLVARGLSVVEGRDGVPEVTPDVRAAVTLASPFFGAVKAAVLIESGNGTKLTHRGRMKRLAVTLPAVYDLLPMYRCVEDGADLRRFTKEDAEAVGGSKDLAHAAIEFNARLGGTSLPGHRSMTGTGQQTLQSLRFQGGVIVPSHEDFEWVDGEPARDELGRLRRRVVDGDETVARDSASLPGAERQYLPQQHGALARSSEAISYAADVIRERETGTRQGDTNLGIEVPDVVTISGPWEVIVTGIASVTAADCTIHDAETGRLVDQPPLENRDGQIVAPATLGAPGVYRVEVSGGGTSPVSQLVLAIKPDE
jgi:hypothetical protein